tara:strand:- start:101 stop:610 length:510 start_codon:yes stop_codon:yes gene_type:complete
MKKIFYCLFLFYIFTLSSNAEIAYIDLKLILNESDVGKFLNSHLDGINKKNQKNYKEIESNLISKEKSLIDKQNILSEEEFNKQLNLLGEEIKKYRSDKKSSLDRLNQIKIDKTKEILKILNPIITNYVEKNSISIVMPKKNIIIGKKKLDITNQILVLLNNKIKNIDF